MPWRNYFLGWIYSGSLELLLSTWSCFFQGWKWGHGFSTITEFNVFSMSFFFSSASRANIVQIFDHLIVPNIKWGLSFFFFPFFCFSLLPPTPQESFSRVFIWLGHFESFIFKGINSFLHLVYFALNCRFYFTAENFISKFLCIAS